MAPAARAMVTLSILRHNLQVAQFIQESAQRRKQFLLIANEAERIAWIQRRIAELEAQVGRDMACTNHEAPAPTATPA